ncbi:ribbon-helix-helix protein, CopG family [Kitasatospora sp. NBC_00070]|uniref:ribbon-helix-helix protein, CopG family n=1 Tax=Kitasatospora sp. NBC_00070 TaxID=2975962 RepID=UPI0032509816
MQAKTRISISLDRDHAERIREHAERAGTDVSAYLVNAATRQMAEAEAAEAQFARIDAMIAAAEAEAEAAELPPLRRSPTASSRRRSGGKWRRRWGSSTAMMARSRVRATACLAAVDAHDVHVVQI